MNTKLLYLEDFSLLKSSAIVADIQEEDNRKVIFLDQTIFYPQGGGQPYDTGTIENSSARFMVEEVRFVDGLVKHIGKFESGILQKGDAVTCSIDADRRTYHSRLHSAGHVVDMAVARVGLDWIPGRGFHFPQGPYVEYSGDLASVNKDALKDQIESLCNQFVHESADTKLLFVEKEKMHEICRFVPDYLPENKPSRVVLYGDFGVPCGGTHVANLSDIGHITIRKIKMEKGNIRVSYEIK